MCTLHHTLLVLQIMEYDIGKSCSIHVTDEKSVPYFSQKIREYFVPEVVCGRIIFKWILRKQDRLVSVTVTTFLKPTALSTFETVSRLSPYLVPSLRKCLFCQSYYRYLSLNRNIRPAQIPSTRDDV